MQICFHTSAWKVPKHGVFSGQYFLVFELNTEIYYVFSPNKGKYIPEKTPYLSIFLRSVHYFWTGLKSYDP